MGFQYKNSTGKPLRDFVETGDIIFVCGIHWFSKMIRKITAGRVNHAEIVVEDQIFETPNKQWKAGYGPLPEVTEKGLIIVRPTFLTQEMRDQIKVLCDKYAGIPYDFWDITLNVVFGFLKDEWKTQVITFLGTKRFMKCDELVSRLLYEVSLRKELRWFEGYDPSYLLKICLTHPESFRVLYWNP